MKFDLSHYPFLTVMHCKTRKECRIFEEFLNKYKKTWENGNAYDENRFDPFSRTGAETCYNFNTGNYSRVDFYRRKGYKILDFSDFEWDEQCIEINLTDKDNQKFEDFIRNFR